MKHYKPELLLFLCPERHTCHFLGCQMIFLYFDYWSLCSHLYCPESQLFFLCCLLQDKREEKVVSDRQAVLVLAVRDCQTALTFGWGVVVLHLGFVGNWYVTLFGYGGCGLELNNIVNY